MIYVEWERVDGGRISQKTTFAAVELAPDPRAAGICADVGAAGLSCEVGASEPAVLWRKLSVLAPIALTTTARPARRSPRS